MLSIAEDDFDTLLPNSVMQFQGSCDNLTEPSFYQAFLVQSLDAFAEYDLDFRYVCLNPTGAAWLGLSPPEAIGKTLSELLEQAGSCLISTQQTRSVRAFNLLPQLLSSLQRVLTTATPLLVTHKIATEDGIRCYETAYTPILDADGKLIRIFSVGRDRTPFPTNGASYSHQLIASVPLQPAALLQSILDTIPQYIFWKDRNSVYLGCNRQWAEMAGLAEPQEVIGKTDYDLPWTKEESDWYRQCDRRVMESGIPELNSQETQRQADGKHTWRNCNKIPLRDPAGNIIGILGTLEDITERKQAEVTLLESEARFRAMAQRENLLNRLASQIRNSLDLDTILATTVNELRNLLHIDRCNFIWYCPDTDPPSFDLVHAAHHPDLSTALGHYPIEDPQSPYIQALLNFQIIQIDDLRRTDTILDAKTRRRLLKQGYTSSLSCPVQTHFGRLGIISCAECNDPRVWQPDEVELIQAIANQLAIALDQAVLYDHSRAVAAQAQAQAKQLEQALQELQQAQIQLIQTEKMSSLGQLVAGIAHEINNPVNFIYGNLSHTDSYTQSLLHLLNLYQHCYPQPDPVLLAEMEAIDLEFITADLPRLLNSMKVGANRIRQIVLSLRNFSRLDESEKKPIDIHEGIDSTLMLLQHRLKVRPDFPAIKVIQDYAKLPLVECYPGQLNQVFMNLLVNAIDSLESYFADNALEKPEGHERSPQIHITTTAIEGDRVQICIADNGAGMAPQVQSRVFDPFFTTKSIGNGTGLGLSISYQIIIHKHGGALRCTSAPGQGAKFYIEIPVRQG